MSFQKMEMNAPFICSLYFHALLYLFVYTHLFFSIIYILQYSLLKIHCEFYPPFFFFQVIGRECVYYFHDMILEMLKWGFQEGKTLFGFGYDFRQSNRYFALASVKMLF